MSMMDWVIRRPWGTSPSCVFYTDKQLTYYYATLTRQGITQGKHMFVNGSPRGDSLSKAEPTWHRVYQNGLEAFLQV